MHDRGELHQEPIPGGLNEVPLMLSDHLLDNLVMCVQPPQHARFIAAPIWRLKPTMSVNMMAANFRVSACLVPTLSSGMGRLSGTGPVIVK
jgi:hypothetical protein